jgi:acetolactate synthase-1/2/3 large subunit
MKASDAIARFLIAHEVQTCFELVGGMITHLLDSFAESGQFNIISMHHEQAAAFAAEGVARQSRGKKMAIAMGTSGPGATNLITGIGSCWFDSVPCLFLTGQVNTTELKGGSGVRQQGFQELDIVETVHSIAKYAKRIESASDLLPELHRALSIALSGRKGPVLLDIPNNLQRAELSDAEVMEWINKPLPLDPVSSLGASDSELETLHAMCLAAKRPLICIGGGARWSNSLNSWLQAAEECAIPYVSTLMGQERIPVGDHYFNMIGSYGNREANCAVQNCDLLIVLGARLDVRQTGADVDDFARDAHIVQIDIDPSQLNNRIKADLAIRANIDYFFGQFKVDSLIFPNRDPDWAGRLLGEKAAYRIDEYADWPLSPFRIFSALNAGLRGTPVDYVCDVGNHQMWAAQNIRLDANQAIHHSGGMGAMGFALPAAIGMSIHSGGKAVVITGDGSLQVNSQELDTLNRLQLDIAIIVMNNASLGMVKNFQDMYFDGRNQSTKRGYSCPSFSKLAAAYGIAAYEVRNDGEFKISLNQIKDHKGPLLIELIMEEATECRPRLAFGRKLDEQLPEFNVAQKCMP